MGFRFSVANSLVRCHLLALDNNVRYHLPLQELQQSLQPEKYLIRGIADLLQ